MLITPEQKRDNVANSMCDNHNEQHQVNVSSQMYGHKGGLDNINLTGEKTDCDNEDIKLSCDQANDCVSTSSSTSTILSDVRNSNSPKSYTQRSMQRLKAKFPPHINLGNPKKTSPSNTRKALFITDDETYDMSQLPLSPMSASPTRSPPTLLPGPDNDKHELISGRLHLIRQTGNVSPSHSPSSPSRAQMKCFPFQVSPAFSSPSSSPPLPSSPTLGSKRKTPVYMRVYKCNMGHFALVSRDSSYSSRHIYLNMRHCRVMPGDCLGRFVIAGHCDSGSLMEFETSDMSMLEKWLDALQNGTPPGSPIRQTNGTSSTAGASSSANTCSPPIPKSPALPTLAETEEEN